MLVQLRLQNFRCFGDHTVPLRPRTVVVGRNNAGKSTIIEALTLVSRVVNRWGRLRPQPIPEWLDDVPMSPLGVTPSLEGMSFETRTVFHHYGPAPAIIEATFASGDRVRVYVGPDGHLWATASDAAGHSVPSQGAGATARLPKIAVLPQVAPLAVDEQILEPGYVRRHSSTVLASQHFRNQLFYHLVQRDSRGVLREDGAAFAEFRAMAEETWPGLAVDQLLYGYGRLGDPLQLLLRDHDFVNEVGRMGHGLQMWLQTVWFLARATEADTVILDEPDVYTHADVQRRLIRLLGRRPNAQKIIATHSVEILSEVPPEDVLVVDRSQSSSGFANSLQDVQALVDRMQSVHSLQMARLWSARRYLLLEGDDIEFLRLFHRTLFPRAAEGLDALPRLSVGGWSGFNFALGGGMVLANSAGEGVIPYCILDSDYHTLEDIHSRYATAAVRRVELHIWRRKEIESYLLVPSAIRRVLASRVGTRAPDDEEIAIQLDTVADELRDQTTGNLADELFLQARRDDPRKGVQGPLAAAQARVADAWKTREGRWSICNAKHMLAGLSRWAQDRCGANVNALAIAEALTPSEIDPEVRAVIQAIERGERFPPELAPQPRSEAEPKKGKRAGRSATA